VAVDGRRRIHDAGIANGDAVEESDYGQRHTRVTATKKKRVQRSHGDTRWGCSGSAPEEEESAERADVMVPLEVEAAAIDDGQDLVNGERCQQFGDEDQRRDNSERELLKRIQRRHAARPSRALRSEVENLWGKKSGAGEQCLRMAGDTNANAYLDPVHRVVDVSDHKHRDLHEEEEHYAGNAQE
jgi:hypothetical protein